MSECFMYVIVKMTGVISQCYIYIIKMRAVIYLNSLYMILKNGRYYIAECCLYDIIKMRVLIYMNAEYMILLKLEILNDWMLYIWYY